MSRILNIENVSKTFTSEKGDNHVLDDVSFSVEENEFVVVFGPGQCGKSTLLNIIAGMEKPSSGRVMIEDKEVTAPGPDRAMVFQNMLLRMSLMPKGQKASRKISIFRRLRSI